MELGDGRALYEHKIDEEHHQTGTTCKCTPRWDTSAEEFLPANFTFREIFRHGQPPVNLTEREYRYPLIHLSYVLLSDPKNDPIEKFPNCSVPQTLIDSNDRAQFDRLQQLMWPKACCKGEGGDFCVA